MLLIIFGANTKVITEEKENKKKILVIVKLLQNHTNILKLNHYNINSYSYLYIVWRNQYYVI